MAETAVFPARGKGAASVGSHGVHTPSTVRSENPTKSETGAQTTKNAKVEVAQYIGESGEIFLRGAINT